jgi:hypothetical protein
MSKVIRVKQHNVVAALAAIPGSVRVNPPDYDWQNGLSDDYSIPAVGMAGIQLPDGMSGKMANRMLRAAGIVK